VQAKGHVKIRVLQYQTAAYIACSYLLLQAHCFTFVSISISQFLLYAFTGTQMQVHQLHECTYPICSVTAYQQSTSIERHTHQY